MYIIYYDGPDYITNLTILYKFKSKREGRKRSVFYEIMEGKDSDIILERILEYSYFGKYEFQEDTEKRKEFLKETYKNKEDEFFADVTIWADLYLINSIEDMFEISCTSYKSLV